MSRATAVIRLPDGSRRWALYEGTSDVIWRQTYPSSREAWDAYEAGNRPACVCRDVVQVDYWMTYADGALTRMDYCPACERLRPVCSDFDEHCEAVGLCREGVDGPVPGWVEHPRMVGWFQPEWVR